LEMGRRTKSLLAAIAGLLVMSLWLASRPSTADILGHPWHLATAGMIALGPVTGWIVAIVMGQLASALWGLLPATLFSVGPLALWIKNGDVPWLIVATFMWLACGYLFAVAMWV
jgi:hypothetical protein